ncbi:MAG: hypothetical protein FH762_19985 [Firmicutes bacterium]|nr:hypothetical protein [Bacillota bacterium]
MKIRALITVILFLIILSSIVIYGQADGEMDMFGKITKVVYDQGNLKENHIENVSKDNKPYDNVVAIISEETKFITDDFEKSDLQKGQIVGIIFKDDPITMIYPARAEAEIIRIKDSLENTQIKPIVNTEIENNGQRNIKKDQMESIMKEYNNLLLTETNISSVINFIDDGHISLLSEEKASQMINEFETLQKYNLSRIEKEFYDNDVQKKIYEIYQEGFDISKINNTN